MLILRPGSTDPVATGRLAEHTFGELSWKDWCWAFWWNWDRELWKGNSPLNQAGEMTKPLGWKETGSLCVGRTRPSLPGLSPPTCVGRNSGFCTQVESQNCPLLCNLFYHRGLFLKEHCCSALCGLFSFFPKGIWKDPPLCILLSWLYYKDTPLKSTSSDVPIEEERKTCVREAARNKPWK